MGWEGEHWDGAPPGSEGPGLIPRLRPSVHVLGWSRSRPLEKVSALGPASFVHQMF